MNGGTTPWEGRGAKKQRKAKEKSKMMLPCSEGGKQKSLVRSELPLSGQKHKTTVERGRRWGEGVGGGGEGSELARESEWEIGWVSEWLE